MSLFTAGAGPLSTSIDVRSLPTGGVSLAERGGLLTRALDLFHQGVVFFDLLEQPVHVNATLRRIWSEHPDGEEVRREIHRFAESLGPLARRLFTHGGVPVQELAVRDFRTSEGSYLLRGSFVRMDEGAADGLLMVVLEPAGAEFLSESALQARYGLTEREVRVARLITLGLSDGDVAGQLCISVHTARHHGEHVRQKLGVRSRGEVAACVLRVGRSAAVPPRGR